MSLNNGKQRLNGNKKSLKERIKDIWSTKEFKTFILIFIALVIIFILQLNNII